MKKGLKDYFPQIRTREEVLTEIRANPVCAYQFEQWDEEQKEEFLDFCTGVRGAKMAVWQMLRYRRSVMLFRDSAVRATQRICFFVNIRGYGE